MTAAVPLPSQAELQHLFTYDPDTGVFRWRVKHSRNVVVGREAGTAKPDGYGFIRFNKRRYYSHRLAWMYVYGEDPGELQIDHIDGDPRNNRINNLRLANDAQNRWNSRRHSDRNNDLPKGVSRTPKGRFVAFKCRGGKSRYIGTFDTPAEASDAYMRAAVDKYGEFARAA